MKRIYLHPLALRIWHWVNALLAIVLFITGIQLRITGIAALGTNHPALLIHRYAGWAMAAAFGFWLVYSLMSGHLNRHYRIGKGGLQGTFRQIRFYLFSIFKGEENPFRPSLEEKFNPLQKLAYKAVMCIFVPMLAVTGVLFSDIPLWRKYILLWDGVKILEVIHVIGAYVLALYLVVHLYMTTFGQRPFSHLKAMIVGYEEEPGEPEGAGREE